MMINAAFFHTLLGWVCQGVFTVGILILAARLKMFPYVVFFSNKPLPKAGHNDNNSV